MKFNFKLILLFLVSMNFDISSALTITKISNINFSESIQGDSQITIDPGSSEDNQNGSFLVEGTPNTPYTIILPSLVNISSLEQSQIVMTISNFQSNPAAGSNGMLDSQGKQTLYLGATQSAVSSDQLPGDYSGEYQVEVVY